MKTARVVNGIVVTYPYPLRPTAKQAHPEVVPLPAEWEQCSSSQLLALECVVVQPTAQPPGAREVFPTLQNGVWTQTWVAPPAYDPSTQTIRWDGTQWITGVRLPGQVSRYQLRRALRALSRLTAFNNYIQSLPADSEVREKWEHGAAYFSYRKAWCLAIQAGLGLSDAQILGLWRAAEAVEEDS